MKSILTYAGTAIFIILAGLVTVSMVVAILFVAGLVLFCTGPIGWLLCILLIAFAFRDA